MVKTKFQSHRILKKNALNLKKVTMKTLFFLLSLSCFTIVKAQDYTGYCDFEEPCSFLRPINPDNFWEVGAPDKPVILAAHSPDNCLITGATSALDTNMHEFVQFDFYVGTGFDVSLTYLGIYFYYQSDLAVDSDFVDVSIAFDSSEFKSLRYLQEMSFTGSEFYTTLDYFISEYSVFSIDTGITGSSDGWETGNIHIQFYMAAGNSPQGFMPEVDTVHLKFTLITDSVQSSHDGFALDDLEVSAETWGAVEDMMKEETLAIYPNPASSTCIISSATLANSIQTIQLYSIYGEHITSLQNQFFDASGKTEISVEGLPPGTYMCAGTTKDTSFKGMFVKL